MNLTRLWAQFLAELGSDPFMVLGVLAALVALATTPLTFAILGRLDWFKARRGRILQRPEFSSIVVGMMLVMAIPAIFAALVIKSRSFDHNRYEFDPNRTWSVLEQGREFKSVQAADAAVKQEMERLALERKNLVDNVKKLDEAMLALRGAAVTSPAVAERIPKVLQSLAGVRKSVGLDGPQQLLDYTAPPVELRALTASAVGTSTPAVAPTITVTTSPTPSAGNGLSPAQVEAEIASVPEPQRKLAAMLPFTDLPPEWTVGKSGERHLEDRRPRRKLRPVWRQGDGLYVLSSDRRPVQRASALRLRDGRHLEGTGQVRLGEARRGADRRDRRRGLYRRR